MNPIWTALASSGLTAAVAWAVQVKFLRPQEQKRLNADRVKMVYADRKAAFTALQEGTEEILTIIRRHVVKAEGDKYADLDLAEKAIDVRCRKADAVTREIRLLCPQVAPLCARYVELFDTLLFLTGRNSDSWYYIAFPAETEGDLGYEIEQTRRQVQRALSKALLGEFDERT